MLRLLQTDWFIPLFIGVYFLVFGIIKFYGHYKGVVGGAGRPFSKRLLGSCPTWTKPINTAARYGFVVVGAVYITYGLWGLYKASPAKVGLTTRSTRTQP